MNRRITYFEYLVNIVGRAYEYRDLLHCLHDITFYSWIPNDDNRGSDGEHLREMFLDEVGPHGSPSLPNRLCTVLEMLIGVAFRLEFDLVGGQYERPVSDWFWILVDNLGLERYDDVVFALTEEIDAEVREKVRILLERRYESDGNGGLFPLKRPQKDQRKVEIWYQMSAWVIQNYPI